MVLSRKIKKLLLVSASTFFIAIFLYLATEVQEADSGLPELIGTVDIAVGRVVGEIRSPNLTPLVTGVTELGSFWFMVPFVMLTAAIFARRRRYRSALLTIASGLAATVVTPLLKLHYGRSRPDSLFRLVPADGFSFPSGHTLGTAAIFLTVAILVSQHLRGDFRRFATVAIALTLILAVGFSRIYLGVHFFSDVIGGACLGVSIATLIGAVARRYDESDRQAE